MIETRRSRRVANGLGAVAVVGLMSYALYAQHVLHLEACPLCIFQRIAMIAVGAAFALAALHAPRGVGARVYAVLGVLAALTGASISAWHVRLQNLPPEEVPSQSVRAHFVPLAAGATLLELAQVRKTLLQSAELRIVESTRRFLAVASDERHRRSFV